MVTSLGMVRKKIHGHPLTDEEMEAIMQDISDHRYRDVEIVAFLSVCAGDRLNLDEISDMTHAMASCGQRLEWPGEPARAS